MFSSSPPTLPSTFLHCVERSATDEAGIGSLSTFPDEDTSSSVPVVALGRESFPSTTTRTNNQLITGGPTPVTATAPEPGISKSFLVKNSTRPVATAPGFLPAKSWLAHGIGTVSERFERIHVSPGVVQLADESNLRRMRHANLP